jgi:hypothetical protein
MLTAAFITVNGRAARETAGGCFTYTDGTTLTGTWQDGRYVKGSDDDLFEEKAEAASNLREATGSLKRNCRVGRRQAQEKATSDYLCLLEALSTW